MSCISMHLLDAKKHVSINGINDEVIPWLSAVLNEYSTTDNEFNRKKLG